MRTLNDNSQKALRFSVISIIISVITAIAIALNVIASFFWPFRPNLTFGMPALRVLAPPLSSATPITIAVPLLITNTGARSGCIADFAVRLTQPATKAKWFLFPAFYVDYAEYLKLQATADPSQKRSAVPPIEQAAESTFYPPFVLARAAEAKTVLFAPRPPRAAPTHFLTLKDVALEREYEMSLLWRKCADTEWRTSPNYFVKLESEDLKDLRNGSVVVPLFREYDETREDLMRRF